MNKNEEVIQVAMAVDAGFVMPLAVTLTSLALAHEPGELAVTVLHDRVPQSDRERVERSVAGRLEVCWRQVAMDELDGVPNTEFLTPATLFRLLLPQFLPRALERVIYLDADMVVRGSLRPLWDMNLGDHPVAAVRDAGAPFAAGPCGTDWRGLGLQPDDPYFNAGLLVISLGTWRSADVSRRVLELLRAFAPRWGDQDGLNVVLRGQWNELPRRWNLQTADVEGTGLAWALWQDDVEQALLDPAVIHYTEREKPWDTGSGLALADRWYEVLDKTAWSGWRPASTSRHLHRRIASRTKRAWRVLTAAPAAAPSQR